MTHLEWASLELKRRKEHHKIEAGLSQPLDKSDREGDEPNVKAMPRPKTNVPLYSYAWKESAGSCQT
jgi:hypothetical protein